MIRQTPPAAVRLAKRLLHSYLDLPVRVAELLRHARGAWAEQFLWRVHCAYPYNIPLAEHLCDMMYDNAEHRYPLGSVERGRLIMQILQKSYASSRVTDAYFLNLRALVVQWEMRDTPGQIVFGLGPGRCGSTTLAAILHSADSAVSTHENPPWIFWEALPRQVQFHVDRFHIFSQYFSLVADCSSWWLNVIDKMFDAFPKSKAIGLQRDYEACIRSWMGVLPEDVNCWVAPYSGIWRSHVWDPIMPHFGLPEGASHEPMWAKEQLVRRYVSSYHERLSALSKRWPERVLLLHTEELDVPATRRRISEFIGQRVDTSPIHLNIAVTTDIPSVDDAYF